MLRSGVYSNLTSSVLNSSNQYVNWNKENNVENNTYDDVCQDRHASLVIGVSLKLGPCYLKFNQNYIFVYISCEHLKTFEHLIKTERYVEGNIALV